MANRNLLAIGDDLEALDALLEEMGGDVSEAEAEAAFDRWFAELGEERDAKLDRYAYYIADLEGRADTKRAMIEHLADRVRIEEGRAKWLKAKLFAFLKSRGQKKTETQLHTFTICNNGGVVPVKVLVDPEQLPAEFRKEKVTYSANTDLIRERLLAGEKLEFASLGDRGQRLAIS